MCIRWSKKTLFFSVVSSLLMLSGLISAQTQPVMPREIAGAFKSGTRSMSGLPGANYWQNSADYNITAKVDVKASRLEGHQQVTYYNNSSDTLTKLVLRLYQDFYKEGNARSWSIGGEDLHEGTQIKTLTINEGSVDLEDNKVVKRTATNMHVVLSEGLYPNDSLVLIMDWSFPIPDSRQVRMGKFSENIVFLGYWYPQIAVYDDVDGWDEIEYLGTVEFYNDQNNYDVTVDVPGNYKVWATGKLQDVASHYSKEVQKRINSARSSGEITTFFTADECRAKKVLKNSEKPSWHFIAKEVPDFTFGLAREVNWQGSFVVVDTLTRRMVLVDAVFPDSSITFQDAAEYSAKSVQLMSLELPGIPFPYEHMTSFSNGRHTGGMESPMMALNGDPVNKAQALGLFYHEISHTYFPFYMGANERKYAWMDEGWAAYMTNEIMEAMDPNYHYFERLVSAFQDLSGSEREVPLMYLSYQIQDYRSYRVHAYNRSAMALAFLRDLLGDEVFKMAFQEFIVNWHGKHPIPNDFFNSFMQSTGQNLWWYFKPWYYDRAFADQGIKKVTFDNKVVVENIGGLPMPVELSIEYIDGSKDVVYRQTSCWKVNSSAVVLQVDPSKKIVQVTLGSKHIPDVNIANNIMKPVY